MLQRLDGAIDIDVPTALTIQQHSDSAASSAGTFPSPFQFVDAGAPEVEISRAS